MDAVQAGYKEPRVKHNLFGANKKAAPVTRHFPLTSSPRRVSFPRLGCSLFRFCLVLETLTHKNVPLISSENKDERITSSYRR